MLSFSRAGADAVGAAFNLIMIVVLPILSFYCLKDGKTLIDKLLLLLGNNDDASLKIVRAIAADTDILFASYMRSLVLLVIVSTIAYWLMFAILFVPYGLVTRICILAF